MKKYLVGVAILTFAFALFGYAYWQGTPAWLRVVAQAVFAIAIVLGFIYAIFPPKDGRKRGGQIGLFPPSWQRWILDGPDEKNMKGKSTVAGK